MKEISFDFITILTIVRKYWKLISAFAIAGIISGYIFNYFAVPHYRASIDVFTWNKDFSAAIKKVKTDKDLDSVKMVLMYNSIIQSSLRIGSTLIRDYQKIIASPDIKIKVYNELKARFPNKDINYTIAVSRSEKSAIMGLSASAKSPVIAATAANLTVEAMIEKLGNMMNVNYAHVIASATPPGGAYFPRKNLNLLVSLFGGIILGCIAAWLIDFFDRTIKTFDDIAEYKMLCLGAIPFVKTEKSDQAIFLESQEHAKSSGQDWHAREAFRLVQSSIRFVNPDNPPKVICTTSVLPNTGKTTVTANLAMTFHEAGCKVLILDCDLRKPHIHKLFAIENDTGIVNYLVDHDGHPLDKFIHRILDGFDIIPCGTIPPNPTQLLHSNKFAEMFSELKRRYDYILVDCPPIANMADTMIIGDLVDGIIMVINPGKTRADYLKHALGQLNEIRQKVVGVVFNKNSPGKTISYEGYYGGYYKGYYKGYYQDRASSKTT
jgi:capsular exopolysaccharide synthesis family protein